MAWEWSHTAEAYDAAHENLHDLPHMVLREIWAEWHAQRCALPEHAGKAHKPSGDFCLTCYQHELIDSAQYMRDTLANAIWPWAQEQATCDNGGFNAWVCPYGCHTVSFSRDDDEEEDT